MRLRAKLIMHRAHAPAAVLALYLSLLFVPVPAFTQPKSEAPAKAAIEAEKNKDDSITLNPFDVVTERDTSYGALNSNSITRFNLELNKSPVVADIFTSQFMEDTAVRSVEELFQNYGGGAGLVLATPDSDGNATQPGDRFSVGQFGTRGLSAGSPRLDGFDFSATNTNATHVFSTERVEVVHGSQGLLYGATGAGGVINIVSKQAAFNKTALRISERLDQYGSRESVLDTNYGFKNQALRVVLLHDKSNTRRLFLGDQTQGVYGQAAFRLPLNTTLRLSFEQTHNEREVPNTSPVNFGNTTNDPRHGYNLLYLLKTNQAGAINPATGAPYPGGAILNGRLSTENAQSLLGWRTEEIVDNTIMEATVDTVWTKWLSTSFGALWDKSQQMRNPNGSNLFSPNINGLPIGGNPLNDWAISQSFADSESPNRKKGYRAAALFTNELFNGKVKSQSSVGFDRQYSDGGATQYTYYLANADGSITLDPTKNNFGRVALPNQWWAVGGGTIKDPYDKVGSQTITINGQKYTRMPNNPRNPAYVSANNPLGLASLVPGITGVSGNNNGSYSQESRNQGWYIANYTSYFNDRLQTLLGMRKSDVFTRTANTTASITMPYIEKRTNGFPSYNAGFVYRLMSLPGNGDLRFYYGYSRTFNTTVGSSDPLGALPPNPTGKTHEAGLKFDLYHSRVSGSLSAFTSDSTNDNYNAGATFRDTVNSNGINGPYIGPEGAKNQWAIYDKTSRGLELLMTASPMKNWRMRFVAALSDGKVKTTSAYGILYNDQFYTDGKGSVTYGNNLPFLVPAETDAASIAKLRTQTVPVDPVSYNVPLVPLTLAMINNVSSPYYAFGQNTAASSQPLNGALGTGTTGTGGNTPLRNALLQFRSGNFTAFTGKTGLPISAIQYNWADPANYQGVYAVQKAGNATVGYPVVRLNMTNDYTFSQRWIKGLRVGGSVALAWYNRTYYYSNPDRTRPLYSAKLENPTFNAWLGYARKFRRVSWSSQLNINNVFNHYDLNFTPNNGLGLTSPANIGISYSGEPRIYVWTNTFAF